MPSQSQFLEVVDPEVAQQRFHAAIDLTPAAEELVSLTQALGRVLSRDVVAQVNIPGFDRSNLDGYAVKAADTVGAEEHRPVALKLHKESIAAGSRPKGEILAGEAMSIATGGMVPRGTDSVVMVELTESQGKQLLVTKAVSPGTGIAFAGTDIACGQTVLFQGDLLTSRETGILAAMGETTVYCWQQPKVAVISTGNEILAPGEALLPGRVYDSNGRIIADAIKELGGIPLELGIAQDDPSQLKEKIDQALASADMVILSGGTSKGEGDLSYRVVRGFTDPGVIVHGVALKPGKPICLAATQKKALIILPGFPTSAIFTFHEFVAPVLRRLAGLPAISRTSVNADLAVRVNSEIGRTEFLLVRLLQNETHRLSAFPIGKGSGSVTAFSHADGFVRIDRLTEQVESGSEVTVQLLSRNIVLANLVIMGNPCVGMDLLISRLQQRGMQVKYISMGATASLAALKRGQCDIAVLHNFDRYSDDEKQAFFQQGLSLLKGYRRQQGLVFRQNDPLFTGKSVQVIIETVKKQPSCLMINRNLGSSARQLVDRLLEGSQPNGYWVQAQNHRAVIAAILQGRADWGIAINGAIPEGLEFLPVQDEAYDFVVLGKQLTQGPVSAFLTMLKDDNVATDLQAIGLFVSDSVGSVY